MKKSRENKVNGLCRGIGDCLRVAFQGTDFCEEHWFKERCRYYGVSLRRWKDLKELIEKQNYTCPYTGRKLVLGENASVDHKNPKTRFPEQYSDIQNMEWVDLSVNLMKRDLTKEEFLELCRAVANRFPRAT